jgi:DNA-binding protein
MSYTQFVATATCTVVDGFNLQSYLDAISTRCVKEENFIFEFYGLDSNDELDVDFGDYVRQNGDNILIECDTEEINSNSEVWDWLIDQFVPIMNCKFVEIKSATIDSRDGVDVHVAYLGKDNQYISTDDLIKNYVTAA